jgi:hypothetical protein
MHVSWLQATRVMKQGTVTAQIINAHFAYARVVAAGNQGDEAGDSDSSATLSSPSVAKNVISVGATLNQDSGVQPSPITSVKMAVMLPISGTKTGVRLCVCLCVYVCACMCVRVFLCACAYGIMHNVYVCVCL